MATDIELAIYMPERQILKKKVYRVVLPSEDKTLTVIKGRAPTLLPLDMGSVKILNENDAVIEEYFVAGGAVDIKEDTCVILTESALSRKDLDLEKATELNNEFPNPFYQWLVDFYTKEKTSHR